MMKYKYFFSGLHVTGIMACLLLFSTSCKKKSGSSDGPPTGGNNSLEITDIQPEEGPPGITVTISGSGFSSTVSQNTVTFNSAVAEVEEASDSELKAVVPEDAASGEVSVTVDGETVGGPAFTVVENMPAVASVDPDSGVAGTEVTITGRNFSTVASENTVTFNGVAASVISAAEDELVTEVPEEATSGPIRVTVGEETGTGPNFTVITTGTMTVDVTTTGDSRDEDGYIVTTGGNDTQAADTNDTVIFSEMNKGNYEVELTGIAGNCLVAGDNPTSVTITAGDTTNVSFNVDCEFILKDKIIFSSQRNGSYKLYVMGTDGSSITRLTSTGGSANERFPSISPDGTRVAYSLKEAGSSHYQIHVINADGTGDVAITSLAEGDGDNRYPSWSPDGSKLVFQSDRTDTYAFDIFVMDADGSNELQITNDYSVFDIQPEWSPDGSKIAFSSNSDGDYDIYTVEPDGSSLSRLTDNTFDSKSPSWSPDGLQVAFQSNDGNKEIYVMNADGTGTAVIITNDIAPDDYPSWSADGDTIVFNRYKDSNSDLYKIPADGSDLPVRLTSDSAVDTDPDWSSVEW